MKVVLDANVVVAAFTSSGSCLQVYEASRQGHALYRSDRLCGEIRRVLRDKLGQEPAHVDAAVHSFEEESEPAIPLDVPASACRDASDLHVLGLAAASGAELLVTGDKDLLSLGSFRGCEIVRPAEALRRLLPPASEKPGSPSGIVAERGPRYGRRRKKTR